VATDPFEELLLRAYPNPDRNGCPGSLALRAAADNVVSFDDPTLQHVRQCSPCFAEFRVFRDARRNREQLRQVAVWAGIAALFIVCVSVIAPSIYRKSHHIATQNDLNSANNSGAKPVARLIALDFRSLNPERGAAVPSSVGAIHSWTIPAALVKLQVTLPFASDDGNYRLELRRDGDTTVKEFSGVALIKEGDTVLTIEDVDLSGIPSGKYTLRFAHADASWHVAPITIQ
jgi:hypothetical protein